MVSIDIPIILIWSAAFALTFLAQPEPSKERPRSKR